MQNRFVTNSIVVFMQKRLEIYVRLENVIALFKAWLIL